MEFNMENGSKNTIHRIQNLSQDDSKFLVSKPRKSTKQSKHHKKVKFQLEQQDKCFAVVREQKTKHTYRVKAYPTSCNSTSFSSTFASKCLKESISKKRNPSLSEMRQLVQKYGPENPWKAIKYFDVPMTISEQFWMMNPNFHELFYLDEYDVWQPRDGEVVERNRRHLYFHLCKQLVADRKSKVKP